MFFPPNLQGRIDVDPAWNVMLLNVTESDAGLYFIKITYEGRYINTFTVELTVAGRWPSLLWLMDSLSLTQYASLSDCLPLSVSPGSGFLLVCLFVCLFACFLVPHFMCLHIAKFVNRQNPTRLCLFLSSSDKRSERRQGKEDPFLPHAFAVEVVHAPRRHET